MFGVGNYSVGADCNRPPRDNIRYPNNTGTQNRLATEMTLRVPHNGPGSAAASRVTGPGKFDMCYLCPRRDGNSVISSQVIVITVFTMQSIIEPFTCTARANTPQHPHEIS